METDSVMQPIKKAYERWKHLDSLLNNLDKQYEATIQEIIICDLWKAIKKVING